MNPFILAFYILACVEKVDTNTSPLGNTSSWNVSMSSCTRQEVILPRFPERTCTGGTYGLINPNGHRTKETDKRIVNINGRWVIPNVQISDRGVWTSQRNCNEGKQTMKILLNVNCERVVVHTGSPLHLRCPREKIPQTAERIKTTIYYESSTTKESLKLLVQGKLKEKAQEMFGGRLHKGDDDHGLKIDDTKQTDEGNYTCVVSWVDSYHKATRKFTFETRVVVAPLPTTARPKVNVNTTTPVKKPTGGSVVNSGTRSRLLSKWYLAFAMLFVSFWMSSSG